MARTANLIVLAQKLESVRAGLVATVAAKGRELADLDIALRRVLGIGGGTAAGNGSAPRARGRGGRRRAGTVRPEAGEPGAGSLAAYALAVVNRAGGKPVTIPEVLKAAKAAGFKTSAAAKNQLVMTGIALSDLVKGGHITKKGRGQYAAKA